MNADRHSKRGFSTPVAVMVALTFFVALPIGLIWVVTDPQARGYLSTAVLALCLLEPLGWLYVWASSSGEKGQHHAQSGRDG